MAPTSTPVGPSGSRIDLGLGEQQAAIVEVGGGLRAFGVAGRDAIDGYDEREMCTGGRGQPLIPWPNCLRDGQYTFDGEVQQHERQIPTGLEPVGGTDYDFRKARPIGSTKLDTGYLDLDRGADGRACVELRHPDGRTAVLWVTAWWCSSRMSASRPHGESRCDDATPFDQRASVVPDVT
ncbi:MAG: hypothetical protein ACR2MK_03290 [Solirubrobacteraceae bacterium]